MAEMQECKNCHKVKPFTSEFFVPRETTKTGLWTKCRECYNADRRARYAQKTTESEKRSELRRLLLRCAEEMSRERAEKRGVIL